MDPSTPGDAHITKLLAQWSAGDTDALRALIPHVHGELRRIAGRLSEDVQGTLQPTVLVNELFLRLVASRKISVADRSHFFAVSAHIMRHILVDHARQRLAKKRGGDLVKIPLDDVIQQLGHRLAHDDPTLLALDEALAMLEEINPVSHRVVEMRIFGGFAHQEISDLLDLPERTVRRRWRTAKIILLDLMQKT